MSHALRSVDDSNTLDLQGSVDCGSVGRETISGVFAREDQVSSLDDGNLSLLNISLTRDVAQAESVDV